MESNALTQLLDLEAIRRVQAQYWRWVDTKDWAALETVFSDDAVFEMPAGSASPGGKAIVASIRGMLEIPETAHHGHSPEISFEDADHAIGIWAMEDELWWPTGHSLDGITWVHGWGHYHNKYVRTADGWRISLLSLQRLRVDMTQETPEPSPEV